MADAIPTTTETWDAETGSFTYDANGNLKSAPAPYSITTGAPIIYDHQNSALSITRSGTTTTYRYNDAGQRITKQVGTGNTEVYLLDGATTLGVFTVNGAGSPVSWSFNVLAGDKVVGRQPNTGHRRHYHTDLLGSTRAVTDSGLVLESYDFEPWGLLMPGRTLGSGTKEGFTGKEQDAETGLDYFGARYYMPALGRWTSVDPLADQYAPWSSYVYTLNNPVSLIDRHGLEAEEPCNDRNAAGRLTAGCRMQRYLAQQKAQQEAEPQARPADEHPACQAGGNPIACLSAMLHPVNKAQAAVGDFLGQELEGLACGSQAFLDCEVPPSGTFGALLGYVLLGRLAAAPLAGSGTAGAALATETRAAGQGFRSFSALKAALGPAGLGRQWHHIVEQTPGNVSRFGAQAIHNTLSVMRLDAAVHGRISVFYSSIQPQVTGSSMIVRKWLSTQSFEAQREVGLQVLRRFGIGTL